MCCILNAPDYEDPQWAAGAVLEVSLLLSNNGDTIEHLLNIDLENINDLPPASSWMPQKLPS